MHCQYNLKKESTNLITIMYFKHFECKAKPTTLKHHKESFDNVKKSFKVLCEKNKNSGGTIKLFVPFIFKSLREKRKKKKMRKLSLTVSVRNFLSFNMFSGNIFRWKIFILACQNYQNSFL